MSIPAPSRPKRTRFRLPPITPTGCERPVSETLPKAVRRIARTLRPARIILFGSYAYGTPTQDSDVDLLVVMPVTGSKREKMVEIGVALHDIPLPKDIIVTTPEDFEWRKEIVGTIERPAVREGKVLYARA